MILDWVCDRVVSQGSSQVCNRFVVPLSPLLLHLLSYVLSQALLHHLLLLSHHAFSHHLSLSVLLNLIAFQTSLIVLGCFLNFLLVELLLNHLISGLKFKFFPLLIGILFLEESASLQSLVFNQFIVFFAFFLFKIKEWPLDPGDA